MGKSKPRHRNRRQTSQPRGIQVPDETSDNDDAELMNCAIPTDELSIQNIIEEIQSPNTDDKLCGLQSLVSLALKPEIIEIIIKKKVIKIIAPSLIDKNSEVRNLTAGVLRNLSASGTAEICERLVKEDIMTPLVALMQQYKDWNPSDSKAEDKDTLLQVVNILWNLCETDDTALKYFVSADLLNILLKCLDFNVVGLDLAISVCQCINSVSEDNSNVISTLKSHEAEFLAMLSICSATNKHLFLKTLAAGVVVNLAPSSPWLAGVLSVLQEALSADVKAVLGQLSSQLPLGADQLSADCVDQLDSADTLVQAQTMALEILTNLTASQDEEMEVESEDSLSEGEEEVNGWSEMDETLSLAVSSEISEALVKFDLISAVFKKMDAFPENVMEIIKTSAVSKSVAKRLERLQCHSFLCFNNLVSALDLEHLGGADQLYARMKVISQQRLHTPECHTELLETSTAAIRAILVRLASIKYAGMGEVQPVDLEAMFKLGQCSEPRVQANVVRIVGSLGMLLINQHPELIKLVGNYLLDAVEKQPLLWLAAEALDSLVDVFSEDCTDEVAVQINLVSRLEAMAPRLKMKMRKERKSLGEHYPVVTTVMTNLTPFIKYKSARTINR